MTRSREATGEVEDFPSAIGAELAMDDSTSHLLAVEAVTWISCCALSRASCERRKIRRQLRYPTQTAGPEAFRHCPTKVFPMTTPHAQTNAKERELREC